jgi:acyl-homoserine lactone acylase PvdQ
MRPIRLTILLLPLILGACAGGGGENLPPRSPAPAQSEILWDTWGVPHVYGRTAEDVGYGYGWAQAQAHADAILRLYGLARGRGAEYCGAGGGFFGGRPHPPPRPHGPHDASGRGA